MGERLQSIFIRLSDGRLLHYTGRKQVDPDEEIFVIEIIAFDLDPTDTTTLEILKKKEKKKCQ